jgi:hypothetical protein
VNRVLLDHLQELLSFPSVTLLLNTEPGTIFDGDDRARAQRLTETAADRLATLVETDSAPLLGTVRQLIAERVGTRSAHALAICVSQDHHMSVLLGGAVDERVVIDETFATRDLVADLNRTASYRVLTISEAAARSFAGDRQRLIEERTDDWPLHREEGISDTIWSQTISAAAKQLHADHVVPTVTAGVERSANNLLDASVLDVIGHVAGNHDRTGAAELHTLVWPVVLDWKGLRQLRAFEELDAARSAKRYAAGVDELWPLAEEGRVEHLVVEDGFSLSARIDDNGQLHRTDDDHREVTEDVIDELIESVLRNGGSATMVDTSTLHECGRVAAVLRY